MRRRIVGVIQARYGSVRFPGKMLAPLGGIPILQWVISRSLRAKRLDSLVLAIPDSQQNEALRDFGNKLDIPVFLGSETDVLGRLYNAALNEEATAVVRICADNPFIDPGEIDRLVNFYLLSDDEKRLDYAFNHVPKLGNDYADGFGAEIIDMDVFGRIARIAKKPEHREHATLYVWDHKEEFKIGVLAAPRELAYPYLRFDIDTAEDLERLENLTKYVTPLTPASDIVKEVLKDR